MYIRKEDFTYLEGLNKNLDQEGQKNFMEILLKASGKRSGEAVRRIQVIDDNIFDERGIEPQEIITRTMIKKAYKSSKEVR